MAAQLSGVFHNPATGDIPCSGDEPVDAWRSDKPLNAQQQNDFSGREANKDEFQPDGGDWIKPAATELDADGHLTVTGVPVAEWDSPNEE